jgi:alkanesulfonate monooxygenase SsuD/methylene tetrahydromethanopterin reductase-like flavin-dependent oxidoreductase (luciferase family)
MAGMGPKMMQLAGEKGDGWIGFMTPPAYLRERVRPLLVAGAERAGRNPREVEMASETICCVHPDREVAIRRARMHVAIYISDPGSDAVIAFCGLDSERDAVRAKMIDEGPHAAAELVGDPLIEALTISGTPEEARERARGFDDVLDELILHPPYMPPFPPEETEDAFLNAVRAFDRT